MIFGFGGFWLISGKNDLRRGNQSIAPELMGMDVSLGVDRLDPSGPNQVHIASNIKSEGDININVKGVNVGHHT